MHGLNSDNEDLTGLDRVRRQIDRVLNRIDPLDQEREKQAEITNIFTKIGWELKHLEATAKKSAEAEPPTRAEMAEMIEFDYPDLLPENNAGIEEQSIVDRLIEIKKLLDKQENVYQEKKRARELRNRAIAEYIILGLMWAAGALTMFVLTYYL